MVQHCHIEFVEHPQQTYPVNFIKFSSQEGEIMDNEVQQLLKKGITKVVLPCDNQVILSIFLRKQRNGSYYMILNLKGLSESIEYIHFKMGSLYCAILLMKLNCSMD